jgi:hypothetical protein
MFRAISKLFILIALMLCCGKLYSQQSSKKSDSTRHMRSYKNVIRYNLSSGLLFGLDKYVILGYERVVGHHQSFSVNIGRASLPKLVSFNTDSFQLSTSQNSNGFNISVDYRFYLAKENKYEAPRGVYIGPYYAYSHFTRDNQWNYKNNNSNNYVGTHSNFTINTIGFELGYQFILWKRLALDMVLIGPGLAFYNYTATFNSNINAATKQQLLDGLKQLLTQKFPGMNYVLANKQIDANGTLRTNNIGYRYLIHIGFNF